MKVRDIKINCSEDAALKCLNNLFDKFKFQIINAINSDKFYCIIQYDKISEISGIYLVPKKDYQIVDNCGMGDLLVNKENGMKFPIHTYGDPSNQIEFIRKLCDIELYLKNQNTHKYFIKLIH
jgi:hypothetical protein